MIKRFKLEFLIHILFWVFIFASVNVEWSSDWFNKSLRPKNPAPLSVLIFPFYFYINFLYLIPKYFHKETWYKYLIAALLVFILPEFIRALISINIHEGTSFRNELFSRDSFLFGAPSPFFLALNASFIYRLAKDWFVNKNRIKELETVGLNKKSVLPYEDVNLLSAEEIEIFNTTITSLLSKEQIFLNSDLTLRELSDQVGSTEKKVSYFISQHLNTNFYDLINKHRVDYFKSVVLGEENKNLSIVGIALNCGFSSKSSFYRSFKSNVGTSPSEYLKKIKKEQ